MTKKCNFSRIGLEPAPIIWVWDKLWPQKFVPACQIDKSQKSKSFKVIGRTYKKWLREGKGGSFFPMHSTASRFCPHMCISSAWSTIWNFSTHLFPNASFLYPLKISENLTIFWCFHGVEKGCIGNEWVNHIFTLWSKFFDRSIWHTKIKVLNFWAYPSRDYWLRHTIYKLA